MNSLVIMCSINFTQLPSSPPDIVQSYLMRLIFLIKTEWILIYLVSSNLTIFLIPILLRWPNTIHHPHINLLLPLISWALSETIKRTFSVTAQFAFCNTLDTLKQSWRSNFPACHVKHCSETFDTGTTLCDVPDVYSDFTAAKLFSLDIPLFAYSYGLKADKGLVNMPAFSLGWISSNQE
jgi:hypothetical protein